MPDIHHAAQPFLDIIAEASNRAGGGMTPTAATASLQTIMAEDVGPFRTADGLRRALDNLAQLAATLPELPTGGAMAFNQQLADWFGLRNMLVVARTIATAALARTESRGAHQREDHPGLDQAWTYNQVVRLDGDDIRLFRSEVRRLAQEELA
jgi:succinate dehydrogenase / fumarate reductase flavoprotein subunit